MGCGTSTPVRDRSPRGQTVTETSVHNMTVITESENGEEQKQTLSIKVEHVSSRNNFDSPSESKGAIPIRQEQEGPLKNRYLLAKKLGRGKFGVVHSAQDLVSGQQVAVKAICSLDPSFRRLDALKEVEIMKALDHPCCIKLLDAWEGDSEFFMVQELAEGGELFEYIVSKGHLLEEEAANFARQILQGLAYMHSNNICHRDLKPQNLLLAGRDAAAIKIADFGLSSLRPKQSDDSMITICGTPDFLAPEVVSLSLMKSAGGYSTKVDVWAVGAILYTMLTGSPPFAHASVVQTLMMIREGKVQYDAALWQGLSAETRGFTAALLQVDAAVRPTAQAALQHAWLAEGAPRRASPLGVSALGKYCLQRRACEVKRLASCIKIMTPNLKLPPGAAPHDNLNGPNPAPAPPGAPASASASGKSDPSAAIPAPAAGLRPLERALSPPSEPEPGPAA